MSKHHKPRSKGDDPSGQPTRLTIGWICVLLALVVTAAILAGQWTKSSSRARRLGTGDTADSKSARAANAKTPLSDSDKDRELRREQLETAEKLLTEFPTNDDAAYLP